MSLGSPDHSLILKLCAAAAVGFEGVEMYWDDLAVFARDHHCGGGRHQHHDDFHHHDAAAAAESIAAAAGVSPAAITTATITTATIDDMEAAASVVAAACGALGLTVVSLQPFRNYDGIEDPAEHAARLDEFRLWLRVAARLGTDMIGVPATIDPRGHTADRDAIVRDMRELGEAAALSGVRVAYENLCFSAAVSSWQDMWDVVRRVDLPSSVLALPDTFNICGSAYADPGARGGLICGGEGGEGGGGARDAFDASMAELRAAVDWSRIGLVQVADGEWLPAPIDAAHPWMRPSAPGGADAPLNPRMAWSRNARTFPFEPAGYLPVVDVLRALAGAGGGFGRAWVSIEVFSRTTRAPGDATVKAHAGRAWRSWTRLKETMRW